ncbi:GNAT family N-acetyltransferase [Nigerium massiliense]|uniref:GNAT family N-acetyltransferase n=1 Tax=Nigerium massiliense TaxID=1522317 RepID=UPI000AA0CC6B|nr:GNAT family protein [Nigerium massiliense]
MSLFDSLFRPPSPYWPVTLQHGPVGLRPVARSDEWAWNDLRRRNDAWTGPWDSTRPPEASGPGLTFGGMVSDFTKQAREGRMLPWFITYSDEGKDPVLAGQLTVSGIAYGSARWAQAGYWVDQKWAGRGIVPTALAMAGDYCFFTLKLHRLEVAIRPENLKSLRVVEKLGFRYESLIPRYLHVDGEWRDHLMFALLADEVEPTGLIGRLRPPGE